MNTPSHAEPIRAAVTQAAPRFVPIPAFRQFPVEALPPVVADLVAAAAAAIGCDPSFVALPALAAVAGCIGNARALLLKQSWIEPAVLWTVTIGESGSHKTPAFKEATRPLMELQADAIDAADACHEEYERSLERWEAAKKETRGDKPREPKEAAEFVTSDATVEALAGILEANAHGSMLARDELDAWIQSFTRYKGKGGGSDRANWLELNSAGMLKINRKTGDKRTLMIRRAVASVTGTIQPAILARAFDAESVQAGFAARVLATMPPRRKRIWTEKTVPEETDAAYAKLLKDLLGLKLKDEIKRVPYVLSLSPPAKRLWRSFYDEWGEAQFNAAGERAAALSKLEAYAARLALIHHVVSALAQKDQAADPFGESAAGESLREVPEESMQAGITLARWFARESERIMLVLRETQEERDTRQLVEWIAEREGRCATVREVQRSNQTKYRTADDAEAALRALAEAGYGVLLKPENTGQPGPKSKMFKLHSEAKEPETTSVTKPGQAVTNPLGDEDETPGIPGESHNTEGDLSVLSSPEVEKDKSPVQVLENTKL